MRVVLGVGLVVCLGCGPPKPTQEEAVAAIEALGGAAKFDENGAVVAVDCFGTKVADAGLEHLK